MKKLSILILLIACSSLAFAQKKKKSKKAKTQSIVAVNLELGYQAAAGDLADRFGASNSFGGGIDYITKKDWIIGGDFNFIFGNTVKEDVLAPLRTENGFLVANNAFIAAVGLRMRANYMTGRVGKLFRFSKTSRSGLRVTIGGGYIQHRIRLQDDPEAPVAALTDEYKKGYDRLTGGIAINEFIGYQYFANNRRINFFIGAEFTQGITKSRRGYNYDLEMPDTDTRFDMLMGLRAGWILPFYFGESGKTDWY